MVVLDETNLTGPGISRTETRSEHVERQEFVVLGP
jgi:hypothetical protein